MDNNITMVDIVKTVLGEYAFPEVYFCKNWTGDPTETIFKWSTADGRNIEIRLCERYDYFEVLGLFESEEEKIREWLD